jgi:hypothetical protein
MLKYFNNRTTIFSTKQEIALGRNPNYTEKWIVAPCAPPYFCIIKNDLVNGRSRKESNDKIPTRGKAPRDRTLNKRIHGINL